MYALPQILSLPILSGLDSGTLDFPAVGTFLAWALVAALVGAGLGFLRDRTTDQSAIVSSAQTSAGPAHPQQVYCEFEDSHREAA